MRPVEGLATPVGTSRVYEGDGNDSCWTLDEELLEGWARTLDNLSIDVRPGELIAEALLDELRRRAGKSDATLESLFLEFTHADAETAQS